MASRKVFIISDKPPFYRESEVEFEWTRGRNLSVWCKNASKLVEAARAKIAEEEKVSEEDVFVLEVSRASRIDIGRELSAFELQIQIRGSAESENTEELATVEVVYQSSKQWSGSQFETDGMGKATEGAGAEAVALSSSQTGTDGGKKGSRGRVRASREAKRKANEHRERKDRLKGFCITVGDKTAKFKLEPPDAFYNWLYITALRQERNKEKVDCLEKCIQGKKYVGFTDIFFKTQDKLGKRYNCQARALAQYISLQWYRHELLEELFPEAVSLEEILDSAEKRFEEYVRKVYLKLF